MVKIIRYHYHRWLGSNFIISTNSVRSIHMCVLACVHVCMYIVNTQYKSSLYAFIGTFLCLYFSNSIINVNSESEGSQLQTKDWSIFYIICNEYDTSNLPPLSPHSSPQIHTSPHSSLRTYTSPYTAPQHPISLLLSILSTHLLILTCLAPLSLLLHTLTPSFFTLLHTLTHAYLLSSHVTSHSHIDHLLCHEAVWIRWWFCDSCQDGKKWNKMLYQVKTDCILYKFKFMKYYYTWTSYVPHGCTQDFSPISRCTPPSCLPPFYPLENIFIQVIHKKTKTKITVQIKYFKKPAHAQ